MLRPQVILFIHILNWNQSYKTHSTAVELYRLYHHFEHPSTDMHANSLNFLSLDTGLVYIRKTSKAVCYHHDPCQKFFHAPRQFKFELKDNFIFNHTVQQDDFYIKKKPIIHVVEETTFNQTATWVPSNKAEDFWLALQCCWTDFYIVPPNVIIHDAERKALSYTIFKFDLNCTTFRPKRFSSRL